MEQIKHGGVPGKQTICGNEFLHLLLLIPYLLTYLLLGAGYYLKG
jgi:hypothetical protein